MKSFVPLFPESCAYPNVDGCWEVKTTLCHSAMGMLRSFEWSLNVWNDNYMFETTSWEVSLDSHFCHGLVGFSPLIFCAHGLSFLWRIRAFSAYLCPWGFSFLSRICEFPAYLWSGGLSYQYWICRVSSLIFIHPCFPFRPTVVGFPSYLRS